MLPKADLEQLPHFVAILRRSVASLRCSPTRRDARLNCQCRTASTHPGQSRQPAATWDIPPRLQDREARIVLALDDGSHPTSMPSSLPGAVVIGVIPAPVDLASVSEDAGDDASESVDGEPLDALALLPGFNDEDVEVGGSDCSRWRGDIELREDEVDDVLELYNSASARLGLDTLYLRNAGGHDDLINLLDWSADPASDREEHDLVSLFPLLHRSPAA